ncbi:DUF2189 domain-containing protein [Chitinimonas sp. BJYL2]|uniref:DUF2189 domain-containing protein n=1 Tax=Chitinimonas sp. BJYL2 TaxID=2976696 RepID=UPI0022B37F54|nr:DUF2189 domain-containing protein [Chitinimonas sp. BJYL2]
MAEELNAAAAPDWLNELKVRNLPWHTPFAWLRAGWGDLRAMPHGSLFYGLAFVIMGWALYAIMGRAPEHVLTLTAAFLLMGPFTCLGLYEISRLHEKIDKVRLAPTFTAFRHNIAGIGFFSALLALLVAGWMRVSVVVFALFFTDNVPDLKLMLSVRFLTEENLLFLVVWLGSGALFAALAFALSVVSIPLMLDRDADTISAMFVSLRACVANPACMLVWGLCIVVLVLAGFALFGLGIIVTAPLVGHATWHAYRALVV